ncbi:hypothetical protein C2845_PM12G23430 [Panicum miliaceum]|uniref:Uncharacterized protein n=1 Tax=Panicum miliaceum TaxID=4540 RepID=A0A3L6QEP4_PANMI|nr:hypothetical protein C2845_PM12G23430 [Panicum miliaceum]
MPYRLVGRYGRLAKAGRADERPVRGLSCSHTAPLQYSQAGAVKRNKGSSQRASIGPSDATHRTRRGAGAGNTCRLQRQPPGCTPTHCSYSHNNSAQLGSYARRPPLAP